MPNLKSGISFVCEACQKGKQTRVSHEVFPTSVTTHCLELVHMDLMGPMDVESFGGKKYSFVCVDDFLRYTWVNFLREKSDTFEVFKKLLTKISNLHNLKVIRIRTDHDLKKKTAEDEVDDLLDNSGNSDVFQGVTTPPTTPPTEISETKFEKPTNENIDEDNEVNEAEKNVPSKIQKNHPTSQVIGDVHGDLQTRRKEKVDYRKMAGLMCMSSTYSQLRFSCFV
ncbi:uncharacterized protein [Henckelia pumila]|uniref:uncharacterized protein isoform X2 n=1 Tax=Henckelia pumila TaxID=405737 RepID=UPI003C6E570C